MNGVLNKGLIRVNISRFHLSDHEDQHVSYENEKTELLVFIDDDALSIVVPVPARIGKPYEASTWVEFCDIEGLFPNCDRSPMNTLESLTSGRPSVVPTT